MAGALQTVVPGQTPVLPGFVLIKSSEWFSQLQVVEGKKIKRIVFHNT